MKAFLLILAAGSLVSVPVVATVASKAKVEAGPTQLATPGPAAEQPAPPSATRQAGALTATFVGGSSDVIGRTFPLNSVAPAGGGEVEAWQGSFNCATGNITLRVGAWEPGGQWGPGHTPMRQWSVSGTGGFRGSLIPSYPYGIPPGTITCNMGGSSWGTIAIR